MSMIWVQALVVTVLVYGIVLFVFGVRNFTDFIEFSSVFNRKRNRLLAVAYLVLPPFAVAWAVEFVWAFRNFFLHPVTLGVILAAVLGFTGLRTARRIDWTLLYRRSVQRVREFVTPLQFFLWSLLIILALAMTWILVGEFWIINGFTVASALVVYLQLAGIYFFGAWFKRRQVERLKSQGQKFTGPVRFEIRQIHVFIFITLNFLTPLATWLLIGDFGIFNQVTIIIFSVIYLVITAAWGFGAIIWKRILKPMAETDSNVQNLVRVVRANRTDVIAGIGLVVAAVLFFALKPLVSQSMTERTRMIIIIAVAAFVTIYILAKYILPMLSFPRLFTYLGFIQDSADRSLYQNAGLRARRFKVAFAYSVFLGHAVVFTVLIYFLLVFDAVYSTWLPFEVEISGPAYPIIMIVLAAAYSLSSLDNRLSGINHELAHKRYYIYKKRKRLMIELEELQEQLEKDKKLQEELKQENISAAIELLRKNGYQIVIGPETRVEKAEKE